MPRLFDGERIVSPTNGAEITIFPDAEEVGHLSLYIKTKSKWTRDLNVGAQTRTLLEENTRVNI